MVEDPKDGQKRHDTYWFSDGNVILKTDATLYRVHKSVLAFNSSFFDALFDIPSSSDAGNPEESMDGWPVVQMVGDLDEDVECVVRVLYERVSVFYRLAHTEPLTCFKIALFS